ncbi:MAG: hypothetical protein AAB835_01570 [Patescibacteria group bacterium]
MLTNADIARIVAVVATKEDIKRVENHIEDLEDNLNRFVTASENSLAVSKICGLNMQQFQLNYLVTRTGLNSSLRNPE